mmetsp:Transcript_1164/g.3138  ORF Transcript_1164/g.3138 Transcript_1164/m.3138 type:complete len:418 (-) Transcript_1164:54-1307(-)
MASPVVTATRNEGVYVAAVEGGGTTFVVSIARVLLESSDASSPSSSSDVLVLDPSTSLEVVRTTTVPSSSISPTETLNRCAVFLRDYRPPEGFASVGIASFGPVGVDPSNESTYGRILIGSPKKEWRGVDILRPIILACTGPDGKPPPHGIDTDVNAPAMAEFAYHKHSVQSNALTSLAYVTVGTGVGVGLVVNSAPVHGMMHPEGGHVTVAPLDGDTFKGYSWGVQRSPYGGKNTVEGITSSVALTERLLQMEGSNGTGDDAEKRDALKDLPDDHPVWSHAANALANLCASLALLTSVEKIVLGGGVMRRSILYPLIRKRMREILNGYLDLPQITTDEGLDKYISGSAWGHRAGVAGSFALAMRALAEQKQDGRTGYRQAEKSLKKGFLLGLAAGTIMGTASLALMIGHGRRCDRA